VSVRFKMSAGKARDLMGYRAALMGGPEPGAPALPHRPARRA